MRALILLSGGLDSSANLLSAPEIALTFDYGQRSRWQEIAQAEALCAHFNIPHCVISIPWMAELNSGLLTSRSLPKPTQSELDDLSKARHFADAVWVPNRNGVFIEIAAALAESQGYDAIVVGFNREEAATFPDNSVDYLNAINRALTFSTRGKVKVIAPTAHLSKTEIVRTLGRNFPFQKLWSCYENFDRMCGQCESCQRLKRALKENEVMDDSLFIHPGF